MPIYEFRCDGCGSRFEDLVPVGTASVPCPKCGEDHVTRLMSSCAFSVGGRMTTTAAPASCTGCSAGSCAGCGGGKTW